MALTKIKSHSVAVNSLTVANIADNAIDATKIASNSILTRHIDDAQITTDQILDGTIATADIADDAVTSAKLDTNIDIAGTLGVTGNITGTLATAAQPNITSLGTLTALTGGTGDLNWDSGTLFVDSSANRVGIGTSSPNAKLDILGTTSDQLRLRTAESEEYKIGRNASTGLLDFSGTQTGYTGYTFGGVDGERMRVTSGGDVSIGSDHSGFSGWRVLNLRGEAGSGALVNWESNNATRKAAIAQSSSDLRLQVFDTGSITFEPGTGTEYMRLDASGHLILGSNLSTVESGKLSVYTDATNDSAIYGYRSTSYFRIVPFLSNGAHSGLSNVNDSGLFFSDNFVIAKNVGGYYGMIVAGSGSIHIGTESEATGSTGGASFSADSSNRRNLILATTGTGSLELIEFRNPNGTVGTIKTNGTTTSYNTSSDYRLKENIDYDFTALDRVTQLKPARFNFITDADTVLDGFLAHEVSSVVPEAVSGEKDATKEEEYEITPAQYEDDGETLISEAVMGTRTVPVYQGIDQSKLVPLLTKAIQEQQTIIESLTARIAALES